MYNAVRRVQRCLSHLRLASSCPKICLMIRSLNIIPRVDMITLLLYIMANPGILSLLRQTQKSLIQTRIKSRVDSFFQWFFLGGKRGKGGGRKLGPGSLHMIWGDDFTGMWLLVLVIFLIPSEILIHKNSLIIKLPLQLPPFGNYPRASVVTVSNDLSW